MTSASPGESQRVHGDLESAIEVPCSGGVDLVLQLGLLVEERFQVSIGVTHLSADFVVAVEQAPGLGDAGVDVAPNVFVLVEGGS